MNRAKHLCAYLVAFLSALLLAAPAAASAARCRARTISNIATIGWDAGGQRVELPSNRVDLEVAIPSTSVTPRNLRLPDGEFPPALLSATCAAAGQPARLRRRATAQPPLSSYRADRDQRDRRRAPCRARARSPRRPIATARRSRRSASTSAPSTATARKSSSSRPAPNSGRFVGIILTTTGGPGRGRLPPLGPRRRGADLMLSDTPDGPPLVQAEIDILVDPFGIAFDSRDGRPVSEVTRSPWSTPTPASRPWCSATTASRAIPRPSSPGRASPTAAATRYDFPAGDYRFPLVRPGRYRLIVEPPEPYTHPSAATPAELAPLATAGRAALHHRRRLLWRRDRCSPARRRCGSTFRSTGR